MAQAIGFIGIGKMGLPMAARLIEAGYPLIAFDLRAEAMKLAVGRGAKPAAGPKELARPSDIVILSLPNSDVVEEVVLGDGGVIEGAKGGSILIDTSTSYPGSTIKISKALAAKGIEMLDAPVSGGVRGALAGTLSVMVGGKEEVFKKCAPVLSTIGKNLFYMGPSGSGHVMKAVNNYLSASSLVATSEAVVLAAKTGLSPKKVVEVLNTSSGKSHSTELKFPAYILPRNFASGFTLGLLNKDLEIFTRLGREHKMPLFVANVVQQIYGYGVGRGGEDADHTEIIKFIEGWAGIEIKE